MKIEHYLQGLELKRVEGAYFFSAPVDGEGDGVRLAEHWSMIFQALDRPVLVTDRTDAQDLVPILLQAFADVAADCRDVPNERLRRLAVKAREHIDYLAEKAIEVRANPLSQWRDGVAFSQQVDGALNVIRNVARETLEHLYRFSVESLGFPEPAEALAAPTVYGSSAIQSILVKTIQHTGTWFAVEFLRSHPEVDGFVEIDEMPRWIIHKGLGRDLYPDFSIGRHRTLYMSHLNIGIAPETLLSMVLMKTIVPLRDPLLSVMTQHNRHPELLNSELIDVWSTWGSTLATIESQLAIHYMPIDLAKGEESRFRLLSGTCKFLGIGAEEHPRDWARRWPLDINTTGHYQMKEAYAARDAASLARSLGRDWDRLKAVEPVLRPWLEGKGYADLLWWD